MTITIISILLGIFSVCITIFIFIRQNNPIKLFSKKRNKLLVKIYKQNLKSSNRVFKKMGYQDISKDKLMNEFRATVRKKISGSGYKS